MAASKSIVSDLNQEGKLTEHNYDIWHRKIQFLLEEKDMLATVTQPMQKPGQGNTMQHRRDNEAYQVCKNKDHVARTLMLSSMRNDLMLHFVRYQTAKEVWEAVKFQFGAYHNVCAFNREISEYTMPRGFKIPKFQLYDGTTDPDEHLHMFKATISIYNLPEPALCKLFSLTLTGYAGSWFYDLPNESISSFSQLVKSFQTNFCLYKRWKKYPHELMYVKQGSNESLKKFVEKLNETIIDIGEPSAYEMVVSAFIHGLQPGMLLKDLKSKIPTTCEEVMVRAYNFYCAEEAITNRMNLGYQKGGRGNTAHKRIRRTLGESDLESTYSSDSLNERKCILEFAAVVKENPGPAGAGVVLHDEDTTLVCCLREGLGITTIGVAEYKALILGLKYALARGYTHIRAEGYSTHVCIQVNGMWKAKCSNMLNLCNVVMGLKEKFKSFEICHVEREYDNEADEQANMAVHLDYGEVQEGVIGDDTNFQPLLEWELETLSSAHQ